ncbi:MAG: group II intron reverse transcriptase/maturase [Alphaproteobacteria bacterium]|nr:group II intron reverse transcriptase/maturase [Alphaproteobacteria bacterium]
MEMVCEPANIQAALKHVCRNKGAPGADGMAVEDLPAHLETHWPAIRGRLLAGTHRPQPVRRVEIPKPGGGVRKLGIPTALDRLIQQAVLQVLQPRWDGTFSDNSFGFRPGRSAHQAVARAQSYIEQGLGYVVDLDLEKFFDKVNHDILMSLVAKRESDKRLLKLIRSFLTAGIMEDGLVTRNEEGTPQGGPLSPILSNVMLDVLDKELESRKLHFVRYADDCNIYVRSLRAGERVMDSIKSFLQGKHARYLNKINDRTIFMHAGSARQGRWELTKKLKLKVNPEKSAVGKPSKRKFLGFSFQVIRDTVKRRLAPKTIERYKERIRDITGRNRGISLAKMTVELARYINGWRGYFGFCETPSVLRRLEQWTRRRFRLVAWKQWKTGRRRFTELANRGAPPALAAPAAGSSLGPWRISRSLPLHIALDNATLAKLGLPSLLEHLPSA